MMPKAEHAKQGTTVIEWTHSAHQPDPDLRWAWKLQSDPPLDDGDLNALLAEIARRV